MRHWTVRQYSTLFLSSEPWVKIFWYSLQKYLSLSQSTSFPFPWPLRRLQHPLLHSRNHRNPTGIIREINFRLNSFQKQGFEGRENYWRFTNKICNTSLPGFQIRCSFAKNGVLFTLQDGVSVHFSTMSNGFLKWTMLNVLYESTASPRQGTRSSSATRNFSSETLPHFLVIYFFRTPFLLSHSPCINTSCLMFLHPSSVSLLLLNGTSLAKILGKQ